MWIFNRNGIFILTVLSGGMMNAAKCNRSAMAAPENKKPVNENAGIAQRYPHDAGIEKDPSILYVEKFDDSLVAIHSRYNDVYNREGMSLDPDVPPGSAGPYSLKMTNIGGKNTGGHLYKSFPEGFGNEVYIRYYVKYPSLSKGYIHHQGIWFGGYQPASVYPDPRAGICGLGDKRIAIAYEPVNGLMGTYLYWGDMQSAPDGHCWGTDMINSSRTAKPVEWDQWTCVEIMIRLNDPVSDYNGELRVWQNGVQTGYWGPGFPKGTSTYGRFTENETAAPFKGFRWRTDPALKITYVWIEFYDDTSPAGESHHIKYDHLVMSKKYIGPIAN